MNTHPRLIPSLPKAVLALAVTALAGLALLAPIPRSGAAAGPTASASGSETVTARDFKFTPGTIKIDRGDRVVWANISDRKHTATSPGNFDTGKIKPGTSVAITFDSRGTFRYHCTIHPKMTGKIVVG